MRFLHNQGGRTPIMHAAEGGHVPTIEFLLRKNANKEAVDKVSDCACTEHCANSKIITLRLCACYEMKCVILNVNAVECIDIHKH